MAKGSRERVKVLLFQFRDVAEEERIERDAFVQALKLSPEQVLSVNVSRTVPEDSMLNGVDAMIIAGNGASVWEDVPNLPSLIAVIKAARAKKLPTLGVCFGAQLIAHVFGGKVIRDKANEERGTFDVTTSDDSFTDLLFADAPFSFPAQSSHHDRIDSLPADATVLASSPRCSVQAFSMPGDMYGVQFHPEFSKQVFTDLLTLRMKTATPEDAAAKAKQRESLRESPAAQALLATFIDRIVVNR